MAHLSPVVSSAAAHVQKATGQGIQAKTLPALSRGPAGRPVPPPPHPAAVQAKGRIIPPRNPGRGTAPVVQTPAPALRTLPTGSGAGEPVVQPFFPMLGLAALGGAIGYNVAGAAATTLATTLYTTAGAVGGWAAGWLAEEAYSRWYGPTVAIVTITGFDLDHPNLHILSNDDVIIRNNFKRLRTKYPHAKLIKLDDLNPQPIPAETLQGVETLNIIGHGDDGTGTVGMIDVDTLFKTLAKNVVAKFISVQEREEKRGSCGPTGESGRST